MTAYELKKIKFGVDNEKYRCYTSPHQAKALWVEPEAPFFVADSHRLLHAEKEKEAIMEEVLSELSKEEYTSDWDKLAKVIMGECV